MKKKAILIHFFLLQFLLVNAQEHKKYNWDETPIFITQDEEDKNKDYYSIFEKEIIDYRRKGFLSNATFMYTTKHHLYQINTEKGIEENNRVYISMRRVVQLDNLQARVIKSNGEIKIFDKKNLKDISNVEELGNYKIFAIEGLEENSQLEILYTLKKHHTTSNTVFMQKTHDVKSFETRIRVPSNKTINYKVYNTEYDESIVDKFGSKVYIIKTKNLDGLEKEAMSARAANMAKLHYNSDYKLLVSNLWENLSREFRYYLNNSKNRKIIKDFKKKHIQKDSTYSKEELIYKFYEYVSSYNFTKKSSTYQILKEAYKSKELTLFTTLKMYAALCKNFNVDLNIVISSDKYIHKFDTEFYSNINLEYFQLYFPDTDKYLDLKNLPTPPSLPNRNTTDNNAMFVSKGSHSFKQIICPSFKESMELNNIKVSIDLDEEIATISNEKKSTGYPAVSSRSVANNISSDKEEEYQKWYCNNSLEDLELIEFETKQQETKNAYKNTPIIHKYKYKTPELIENLGGDYIISIGAVIGTQSELYQETERKLPIDVDYNHGYEYKIDMKIPSGYFIKNPESLNISNKSIINNQVMAKFNSYYKIENDHLIINIEENYSKTHFELEEYDSFKNVINSAYDFFKTEIILESKKNI